MRCFTRSKRRPSSRSFAPTPSRARSAIRFTAATTTSSAGISSAIPASARSSPPTSRRWASRSSPITSRRTTTRCSTRPPRVAMMKIPRMSMATRLKDTEVVIIGLGATGGVAALPIALPALDIVALEAGTWMSKNNFAPDELRNNVRDWPQAVQKAQHEIPTTRVLGQTLRAAPSHPMMNAVGGTALHYWAQSWRLNPWDFKVVSETTKRYGASRIPKGSTVEDWPFGYEELESYYDRVEREIGVSGQAGNVKGRLDQRGNIFEGPRSREFPMPPLRGTA